jgi:hypothetical protein
MEDFMDRAIPLVPPGRAKRVYDREAERQDTLRAEKIAAGKKVAARKPPLSENDRLRSGARALVNAILANANENGWLDVEVVDGNRRNRRLRRSDARRFSHHCCKHGGSCRGEPEQTIVPAPSTVTVPVDPPLNPPELDANPDPELVALIERVLASRASRLADGWVNCPDCDRQFRGSAALRSHRQAKHSPRLVREVVPGDIERLLRECG